MRFESSSTPFRLLRQLPAIDSHFKLVHMDMLCQKQEFHMLYISAHANGGCYECPSYSIGECERMKQAVSIGAKYFVD